MYKAVKVDLIRLYSLESEDKTAVIYRSNGHFVLMSDTVGIDGNYHNVTNALKAALNAGYVVSLEHSFNQKQGGVKP